MRLHARVDADEAILRIAKTLERKKVRANEAMKESAYIVFDKALEIMAEDTGAMKRSGSVTQDTAAYGTKRYTIEFNGPYAWEHEHWHSDRYYKETTPGTEPKALAKALERTGGPSAISSRIARAVRKV